MVGLAAPRGRSRAGPLAPIRTRPVRRRRRRRARGVPAGPHHRDEARQDVRHPGRPRDRAGAAGTDRRRVPGSRHRRRGVRHQRPRRQRPLVPRPDRRHPQLHARGAALWHAARHRTRRRAAGRGGECACAGHPLVRAAGRGSLGRGSRAVGRLADAAQDLGVEGRIGPGHAAAVRLGAGRRLERQGPGLRRADRRRVARSRARRLLGLHARRRGRRRSHGRGGPQLVGHGRTVRRRRGGRGPDNRPEGRRTIHERSALATNGILHDEVLARLRG